MWPSTGSTGPRFPRSSTRCRDLCAAAPVLASPALPRIWKLRHVVTPYDAAYVALAEALDVVLVTLTDVSHGLSASNARSRRLARLAEVDAQVRWRFRQRARRFLDTSVTAMIRLAEIGTGQANP